MHTNKVSSDDLIMYSALHAVYNSHNHTCVYNIRTRIYIPETVCGRSQYFWSHPLDPCHLLISWVKGQGLTLEASSLD